MLQTTSVQDTPLYSTVTYSAVEIIEDEVSSDEKRRILMYSMGAVGVLLVILILCVCVCIVILVNSKRNQHVQSRSSSRSTGNNWFNQCLTVILWIFKSNMYLFTASMPRTPSTIIIHDVIQEEEAPEKSVEEISSGAFYLKLPEYSEKTKPPSYALEK